jgi:transcription elongation factor Elf1
MTPKTNDSEEETVPKEAACPRCGERRVDELILHEDDTVDCLSCDNHYALPATEKPEAGRGEAGQA